MKHNIEWMICSGCGAYLYPPKVVSEIGLESYEEIFEVPPVEPVRVPSAEELAEINRGRREAALPEFRSADEWKTHYEKWALAFRKDVEARVRAEYDRLRDKLRDLTVVEEEEAFRLKGKRWEAVYEGTPTGWKLRCPKCNAVALEWSVKV